MDNDKFYGKLGRTVIWLTDFCEGKNIQKNMENTVYYPVLLICVKKRKMVLSRNLTKQSRETNKQFCIN